MKNFSVLHEISLNDAAMTLLIANFGILMTKPFEKWDAFKQGIIDKTGEVIKKPSTAVEKKSFGKMEKFILKIKKTMLKYIKSERLISVLVYAYILKMESPNIAILELEENITLEERNDLIDFIKGYYERNREEFK